jgi:hypothetical protein
MTEKNYDPTKVSLVCSTCGYDVARICPLGQRNLGEITAINGEPFSVAELTDAKHECFKRLAAKMHPNTVADLLCEVFAQHIDRLQISNRIRESAREAVLGKDGE